MRWWTCVVALGLPGGAGQARADEPRAAERYKVVYLTNPASAPDAQYTISFEPVSAIMTTTLSAQVEREVIPHLGIAALFGGGSTKNIAIGDRIHNYSTGPSADNVEDIRYKRIHAGAQANYYTQRFRGGHGAAEIVYVHYGWANPSRADIDVISGNAYAGWKWIVLSGLTVALQAGIGIVLTNGEDTMTAGWTIDREGTLGPIHLAANLSLGWSF